MSNARQTYEQKPEVRLKRHLKNTDPEYVKKRKLYAEKPEVKERRKVLNNRRRTLCSHLINLLKTDRLYYENGDGPQPLQTKRGRLINCINEVVVVSKKGELSHIPYKTEVDLECGKYDQIVTPESDKAYYELLEQYEEWCREQNLEMIHKDNLKSFIQFRNGRSGEGARNTGNAGDSSDEESE
jgi:hypothetical protein